MPSKLVTCPLCQAFMELKQGKYGAFYGCSGYPRCRGSRHADGRPGWGAKAKLETERPAAQDTQQGADAPMERDIGESDPGPMQIAGPMPDVPWWLRSDAPISENDEAPEQGPAITPPSERKRRIPAPEEPGLLVWSAIILLSAIAGVTIAGWLFW